MTKQDKKKIIKEQRMYAMPYWHHTDPEKQKYIRKRTTKLIVIPLIVMAIFFIIIYKSAGLI